MPSYVIVTQTAREPKVVTLLAERGIAAYCPVSRKRYFTDRGAATRDLPIFPRYVFVCTDNVDRDALGQSATARRTSPRSSARTGARSRSTRNGWARS